MLKTTCATAGIRTRPFCTQDHASATYAIRIVVPNGSYRTNLQIPVNLNFKSQLFAENRNIQLTPKITNHLFTWYLNCMCKSHPVCLIQQWSVNCWHFMCNDFIFCFGIRKLTHWLFPIYVHSENRPRMEKSHCCWPRTAWFVVNVFHKNGKRPLIMANGTTCYSNRYCNSPRLYIRLKYLYSVISLKLDWLPGNIKKWTIDYFVAFGVRFFHSWAGYAVECFTSSNEWIDLCTTI